LYFISRQEVIERLQNQHSLVILVTNSLTSYMDKVRHIAKGMFCLHFVPLYNKIFEEPLLLCKLWFKYLCSCCRK